VHVVSRWVFTRPSPPSVRVTFSCLWLPPVVGTNCFRLTQDSRPEFLGFFSFALARLRRTPSGDGRTAPVPPSRAGCFPSCLWQTVETWGIFWPRYGASVSSRPRNPCFRYAGLSRASTSPYWGWSLFLLGRVRLHPCCRPFPLFHEKARPD